MDEYVDIPSKAPRNSLADRLRSIPASKALVFPCPSGKDLLIFGNQLQSSSRYIRSQMNRVYHTSINRADNTVTVWWTPREDRNGQA